MNKEESDLEKLVRQKFTSWNDIPVDRIVIKRDEFLKAISVKQPDVIVPLSNKACVHTEHCCVIHGCKYGSINCPVEHREKLQSYPCESCDDEGIKPQLGKNI